MCVIISYNSLRGLPIPPIAIALVMLYYGPDGMPEVEGTPGDSGSLFSMFALGTTAGLLSEGILSIIKVAKAKRKNREQFSS